MNRETREREEIDPQTSLLKGDGGGRFYREDFEEEVSLLDYWRVIWKWKWLIILLGILATGTSGWVTYNMPKIYKATTVILPLGTEGTGGLGAALSAVPLAGAFGGVAGIKTPADQLLVVLESRTIAEKIIETLSLRPHYHYEIWDGEKNNWKEGEEAPFLEETVKIFHGNVNSKSDRNGSVTITVLDRDPKMAAEIGNAIVSALAEFLNDRSLNINFQTIDQAVPPEKKFKPSIRTNVLIAGVLALFIGIFLAFFIEYVRRVRQQEREHVGG